jgi:hypothetical protein
MSEDGKPPNPWVMTPAVVGMLVGFIISLAGTLLLVGEWKSRTESQVEHNSQRIDKLESYVPIIIGVQHDTAYLADRARREDQRKSDR